MKRLFLIIFLFLGFGVSLKAQCDANQHNTSWYDEWISCQTSENPNSSHGLTHWILYQFQNTQKITGIHLWNTNIPDHLNTGIKEALIEYSLDGEQWETLDTFTFSQATGNNSYTGFDISIPHAFKAQYVLITALNNYGGTCYGLSEIRFETDSSFLSVPESNAIQKPTINLSPNPFYQKTTLTIKTSKKETININVIDTHGKTIFTKKLSNPSSMVKLKINGKNWPAGLYIVSVRQGDYKDEFKLIKSNR